MPARRVFTNGFPKRLVELRGQRPFDASENWAPTRHGQMTIWYDAEQGLAYQRTIYVVIGQD